MQKHMQKRGSRNKKEDGEDIKVSRRKVVISGENPLKDPLKEDRSFLARLGIHS